MIISFFVLLVKKKRKKGDFFMKANEEKKKYYKLWRSRNKERIKAYNERYWQKRAEKAEKEGKNYENISNNS